MGVYRSFLFAPGNHPRKVEKVFDAGSDAVILDLEDAVANVEKVATRDVIVEALQRPRRNLGYVRINSFETEFCFGDIDAIVQNNGRSINHIHTRRTQCSMEFHCGVCSGS